MFLFGGWFEGKAYTESCRHYDCYISGVVRQKTDVTMCTEVDCVAVVWQETNYCLSVDTVGGLGPHTPTRTHACLLGQVPSEQVSPHTRSYWGCALNAHYFAGYLISQVADRTEKSLRRNTATFQHHLCELRD